MSVGTHAGLFPAAAPCFTCVVWPTATSERTGTGWTSLKPQAHKERRGDVLAVLDRFAARLDEITEQMVEHYLNEVPVYSELPRETIERDVRLVSRRNLEIFMSEVREEREPLEEELSFLREGAARRVDQGVPLTDLLHAYRAGTRIAWYAVLEELESGTAAEREASGHLAAALLEHLDRVSTAVEGAYLSRWHTHIHRTALHRSELASELLADPDPARVRLLASEAGVALSDELILVALPAARRVDPVVEKGLPGFLTEIQGRSIFLLDPGLGLDALDSLARRSGSAIGVSQPRRWTQGMGPCFTDACRMADLAVRLGISGPVLSQDLLVERLLASDPELATKLYSETFKDLEARDHSGMLVSTIEAYLETGNSLVRAAAALQVHPNTVAYRLERARDIGGIDLDTPDGRFRAHLALRARRV